MGEAVRTSTSTFGIWAIIVVAVIVLAVWLVGVSVADNIQTRESRRWWQRVHGSEPEQAMGSAVVSEVPGQRRVITLNLVVRRASGPRWARPAPGRRDLAAQR